jgi:hypothetical protein
MRRGTVIAAVALAVVLLCACGITSACSPSSPGYTVVHHHHYVHHDSGHRATKRSTPKPVKTTKKKSLK